MNTANNLIDTGSKLALPLDGTTRHTRIELTEVVGVGSQTLQVYFVETQHEGNATKQAAMRNRLYSRENSNRLRQEYLLGVGGIRALNALGHGPLTGLHMNEGHCTFAALEMLSQGWSRDGLRARSLFTTHTPVPAGHDRFAWEEVESVVADLLPDDVQSFSGCEESW